MLSCCSESMLLRPVRIHRCLVTNRRNVNLIVWTWCSCQWKEGTVNTLAKGTFLIAPCFFGVSHTRVDAVFDGLSESAVVFLGRVDKSVRMTEIVKRMTKKVFEFFLYFEIFNTTEGFGAGGYCTEFVEQSVSYRMVYNTLGFGQCGEKIRDQQDGWPKNTNFDKFVGGAKLAAAISPLLSIDVFRDISVLSENHIWSF